MTADLTDAPAVPDLDVLEEVQRRVLWLAVRIVDAANHERDTEDGVKVGGHQASSRMPRRCSTPSGTCSAILTGRT
jgi:pyruvate dehydrogenase complex dehydrogenase (E1) component